MKTLLKVLGCLAIIVALVFFAGLWGLWKIMSPGPHVFLLTKDPNGRKAALSRPGGSMEPIFYGVFVDDPSCTAARLGGYEAEKWVRLQWTGPNALTIRYGLPTRREFKAEAPQPATGAEACKDVKLTIVEDPALVPPLSVRRPGYSGPEVDQDAQDNLAAEMPMMTNLVGNAQ